MNHPSSSSSKHQIVQISLYARKLKNVAGFGKGTSDPFAIVAQVASDPREKPRILGQTEVIKNTLDPRWVESFEVQYEFGRPTRVNVGIYDKVSKAANNKPMGSAIFEIGEVLGARGNIKAKKLKYGGTLFCRVQKAPDVEAGMLHFSLRGVGLKNVDGMFSKSDPFFEISKSSSDRTGGWQVVYRSEVCDKDLNPKWKHLSIKVNDVCGGDRNKGFLVEVKDWDKKGKHTAMGSFETTVNALLQAKVHSGTGDPKSIDTSKSFKLHRKGKFLGYVAVTSASVEGGSGAPHPSSTYNHAPPAAGFGSALGAPPPPAANPNVAGGSYVSSASAPTPATLPKPMAPPITTPGGSRPKFVDYLSGGLELQLSVAVDFTGSNGDPRKPGTLHHIHRDGSLNDYEKALSAVGSIIARYDSDQRFPMLGFGAKIGGQINHCFQLGKTPEVSGIKGMLDAYRATFLTGLVMSSPTVFAETISMAAAQARSRQAAAQRIGQQFYHILLILTDGAVTDINQTKQAIKAASDAPLSIVIVGIGSADFSAMQFLDDFQTQEGGRGRDICQFVEFQRHAHNKIHLTQATLDEIPDQVVDYFVTRNMRPLAAIHGSKISLVGDEYNAAETEIGLNVNFGQNGEINLMGAGIIDETAYGTYNTYAGLTPMAPPAPSAPPGSPGYVTPGAYAPHRGTPQVVSATVVTQPVFHVQLPQGVVAGQQLQLQNPQTKQTMFVTVPPGIAPGGTFPVPY